MKKIVLFVISSLLISSLYAQVKDTVLPQPRETRPSSSVSNRTSNDHFMIQYGYSGWANTPDTINTGGFSKAFNIYIMLDFPFKTNPKLSAAAGIGIGSDHIKFKRTYVGIKDRGTFLPFVDQSDTFHFKKTKLVTTYVEVPVELRYTAHPERNGKGFKAAIGVKGGLLINAHTRNKLVRTKEGNAYDDYTLKESSKKFFNNFRFVGTARVGLGHVSLFGTYQINALFKEGAGPNVRPFSIGLTLSGL